MSGKQAAVVDRTVAKIWEKYDKDKSNFLDRSECRPVIKEALEEIHGKKKVFTDAQYDAMFKQFDKNGDGRVTKEEMKAYIAKLVSGKK